MDHCPRDQGMAHQRVSVPYTGSCGAHWGMDHRSRDGSYFPPRLNTMGYHRLQQQQGSLPRGICQCWWYIRQHRTKYHPTHNPLAQSHNLEGQTGNRKPSTGRIIIQAPEYPFSTRAVCIGKIKRGAFIPLHSHTKHTCILLVH